MTKTYLGFAGALWVMMGCGMEANLGGTADSGASSPPHRDPMTDGAIVSDGAPLADAVSDGGADVRAPDGSATSVTLSLTIAGVEQNCMPVVPPDPMNLRGTLTVANAGTAAVGPVTVTEGRILSETFAQLATFAATAGVGVVGAGASGSFAIQKQAASMVPASGCNTISCTATVYVELVIAGAGISPGTTVRSPLVFVGCVF